MLQWQSCMVGTETMWFSERKKTFYLSLYGKSLPTREIKDERMENSQKKSK